jgi:redox-sensing transcriptional repressor
MSVGADYGRAPEPTLARLTRYLRCLRQLAEAGVRTISSKQMEEKLGVLSAQIRKDLSYFGEFGKPGVGYDVRHLLDRLTEVMQLDREHRAVIAGAGNLGSALAGYAGFTKSAFRIVGIFDNNLSKIGRMLWDLQILDIHQMPEINHTLKANIGIIAVPSDAAQEVADIMVESGIRAILNFAPARITVPAHVAERNVDFLRELEILSYYFDRLPPEPDESAPPPSDAK